MRIAVAGFMHESNTFNPMKADRAAFLAQSLTFGPAMLDDWRDAHHEIGGFFESLRAASSEATPTEAIPIGMAWATPSGPVTDDVFEKVLGEFIERIRKVKPDGLLLALHGAMVTQSHLDGDGEVLARLRAAFGPNLPIVLTLDLHGNLSERLIALSTAAIAYCTCPHVDQRARGAQAAELLLRTIRGEVRPKQAISKPPVIVNIMVHDTSVPPLKGLMEEMRNTDKKPGILAVSMLPGFAYADVPQMGPSLVVVADGDADLAHAEADRLGKLLWDRRELLVRPLPGPVEAVAKA